LKFTVDSPLKEEMDEQEVKFILQYIQSWWGGDYEAFAASDT